VGAIMRKKLKILVSLPQRTQGINTLNDGKQAFLSHDTGPEKVISTASDEAPLMVEKASK